MGATSTALPAAQLLDRADDAPCLLTSNIFEDATDVRANIAGSYAVGDGSDASFPYTRLYDRNRGTLWKYGSSRADVYILLDAGVGATLTVDGIMWEGAVKAWRLSAGASVRVRASDALDGANMLLSPTTITTISGPFATDIYGELWSTSYEARYWEVLLHDSTPRTYQLAQLWLSVQRQANYSPDAPYDPNESMSRFDAVETLGGMEYRASRYSGRKRRRGMMWYRTAAAKSDLLTGYNDTSGWSKPLWWIDDPTTDPTDAIFGTFAEEGLYLPSDVGVTDAADQFLEFDFREQLPRGTQAVA
jgi:hypothetical protein